MADKHESTSLKLNSVCFRCGRCCRYGICLTLEEAEAISRYTGLPMESFLEQRRSEPVEDRVDAEFLDAGFIEPYRLYPEGYCLIKGDNGCIFFDWNPLKKEGNCLVHPVKPDTCRDYLPSFMRDACKEGLKNHWGLSVTEEGELSGPQEKLRQFKAFLKSLAS